MFTSCFYRGNIFHAGLFRSPPVFTGGIFLYTWAKIIFCLSFLRNSLVFLNQKTTICYLSLSLSSKIHNTDSQRKVGFCAVRKLANQMSRLTS